MLGTMLYLRDSKTNNKITKQVTRRECIKCEEKPWSCILECVSSYFLEFSGLFCFSELSLP